MMKIFSWDDAVNGNIDKVFLEKGTALTVGVFDGIHAGHKELLKSVIDGKKRGLSCGVVTFTDKIFSLSKTSVKPLESLEERLNHFEKMGIDFVILIDFTESVAGMDGVEFLEVLFQKCALKLLVEGEDFRFGKGGKTGMEEIKIFSKDRNIDCMLIPPVMKDGQRISSTLIRKLIHDGNTEAAKNLL